MCFHNLNSRVRMHSIINADMIVLLALAETLGWEWAAKVQLQRVAPSILIETRNLLPLLHRLTGEATDELTVVLLAVRGCFTDHIYERDRLVAGVVLAVHPEIILRIIIRMLRILFIVENLIQRTGITL